MGGHDFHALPIFPSSVNINDEKGKEILPKFVDVLRNDSSAVWRYETVQYEILGFLYDELYRKPRCRENTEDHFIINHCKYTVACCVLSIDVEIDVEEYRSFNNINPRYILSGEE